MKYRYNNDYLMVNKHTITLELSRLLVVEDKSGLKTEKRN